MNRELGSSTNSSLQKCLVVVDIVAACLVVYALITSATGTIDAACLYLGYFVVQAVLCCIGLFSWTSEQERHGFVGYCLHIIVAIALLPLFLIGVF